MQMEVIKCNTKVAMETIGEARNLNTKSKMAESRFVSSDEIVVDQLKLNAKNKNTTKSTQTWLNVWEKWANERKFNPKLKEYEHEDLDKRSEMSYAEVRTKDALEYEPETLKSMLVALDRHLKESDYKYSIMRDREFYQSKLVLEGKVKHLRQQGKGKRPNAASALTAEEEEILWTTKNLSDFGPRVLSQTMWWVLTQHFGLRGRQEHRSVEVEDFAFCQDDCGTEYITFRAHPKKTRQGELNTKCRTVLARMFATSGPRCPVQLFKQYPSPRPLEFRDNGPFYLAVIDNPKIKVWYKKQRLGVNSIDQMMKNIIKNTPLETSSKRLSNHSVRKTVLKKLRAANVERQSVIQVTGHANEKSLNDYDEATEREHRELSHIITGTPQTSTSNSFPGFPVCSFPTCTEQIQQASSHHAFTVLKHSCQITFNVIQGQCGSPKSLDQH